MATAQSTFKEWAFQAAVAETAPLEQLQGRPIAIEAEEFLHSILNSAASKEPLLPALGGNPFSLETIVTNQLSILKRYDIRPHFVFGGLDTPARDRKTVSTQCATAAKSLDRAWNLYNQSQAEEAVNEFGKSCTFRIAHILRWLQCFLHTKVGVDIQVAPYSAAAQITQLEKENFVQASMGSSSLLLYGLRKVIVSLDWDMETFSWVTRQKCETSLALSAEQFTDAILLSGESTLPPCPQLENDNTSKIKSAASLLRPNRDGNAVCQQSKDEEYLSIFRKAKSALRHAVVITGEGEVLPQNLASAPGDIHAFTGSRLPDEIYFYLSRGVIGPRLLHWRTSLEIFETPPLDGGLSAVYKELVSEKLTPLRAQAIALLSGSLHRYYVKKDVELVTWFDESSKRPLGVTDIAEPAKAAIEWHVRQTVLDGTPRGTLASAKFSSLSFGIHGLANDAFAKGTITPRKDSEAGILQTKQELYANTSWRFLQGRGYSKPDHTLSPLGRAYLTSLEDAEESGVLNTNDPAGTSEIEEAIFIAFETLRLGYLNNQNMFQSPPYSGGPMRGSNEDKANTLLVSRVACLARLKHKAIGYTGPLSRHLLAFHSMTTAVRSTLRDLVEMYACNLLIGGAVSRKLKAAEYSDLGFGLPFIREPDLALGLATKTFLDELSQDAARRSDIKTYFPHALDFEGDLKKVWRLFRAINAGVQACESDEIGLEDKKHFAQAATWLDRKLDETSD